ncbi:MAG: hypothetical protein AAF604_07840 [Acidobacteriota bacterium]
MKIWRFLTLPFREVLRGQELCLRGLPDLGWMALGLLVGWFVYVPLHELLHAFACLATGGEVTRLEIDHLYGGALWARLFPFVVAGSDYAGRLSGFDTFGNDAIYLATDLGPFLLTLPGVWALRRWARQGKGLGFGFTLPFALAPFLSLNGDAYEIGSILVTRLAPWSTPVVRELLRGDDVFLVGSLLGEASAVTVVGFVLAALLGVLWAFATYGLAAWLASRLGQGSLVAAEGEA